MSGRVKVIVFPDVRRLARDWEKAIQMNRRIDSERVHQACKARRDARRNAQRPALIVTVGK